jgi:hypothetical protein
MAFFGMSGRRGHACRIKPCRQSVDQHGRKVALRLTVYFVDSAAGLARQQSPSEGVVRDVNAVLNRPAIKKPTLTGRFSGEHLTRQTSGPAVKGSTLLAEFTQCGNLSDHDSQL